jgi:hypothetical protein
MSNSLHHNCAQLAVMLIPQSRDKDLAHEASDTLEKKCVPSYERFLASLGMTFRETL